MRQANERTVSIRVMAVAVLLAAAFGTNDVYAQKGRDGPSYTLQVLSLPTGFVSARDVSINDRHEIVGTVRVGLSGGHSQAVYWAHASAAPVLLPCLSEPCESRATAINSLGVISGAANDQAVLWHPSGTSWIPKVLLNPDPWDETSWARANDVLDDGTAGGSYDPTRVPWTPNEVPVIWGAYEAVTELPLPEGFLDGSLRRMNDSRDGVGAVRTNDGTDPTYVYGALWINDDGTYVTLPLTYFVNDITPRAADGSSFLVASDAGRLRVWKDADSWNYAVDANPGGSGTAINAAGDMAGVISKGGWMANGGTPYLLTAGGTLTKLPLPSRATGVAADVSGDRWVAGWLYLRTEHPAAVWAPPN
jgi:hypothetical protein